jgi:hypothetical protein
MTSFQEQEINQDIYQGASFREVKLIFNRNPLASGAGDWFDNKKYDKEILPKLLKIKPPAQVRCKKKEEKPKTESLIVVHKNGFEEEIKEG